MDGDSKMLPWMADMMRNPQRFSGLFCEHLEHPEISAAQHAIQKRLLLAERVLQKTRIYLDQKYWIYCRGAFEGKAANVQHKEILDLLTKLVDSGLAVCPVSYSTLEETAKQGEPERRRSTAELIDALSRGIALAPPQEQTLIEFCHLWNVQQRQASTTIEPIRRVWTFAGWIVGEWVPKREELDPTFLRNLQQSPCEPAAFLLALEKFIYDRMADMLFSEALDFVAGPEPSDHPRIEEMAKQFNAQGNVPPVCRVSFAELFKQEVASFLDSDVLDAGEPGRDPDGKGVLAAIRAEGPFFAGRADRAFIEKIKKECGEGRWTTQFPFLHIFAGIHALSRHRNGRYEANDLWDCAHACAALPYCDAFFTERNLATQLTQPPLNYDRVYDCRVFSTEDDVLNYLHTLATQPTSFGCTADEVRRADTDGMPASEKPC